MDYLIVVCTVSIISLIAFTYLPVTNTTAKVNATPNTTLHKDGVPKPSEDFLIPYYKGMAYLNAGNYTESIPYFDKVLAIQPTNALALAGKELDFAAFSKTNIIAKPTGAIATPQNPQASDFGYYIQKRATAPAPPPS